MKSEDVGRDVQCPDCHHIFEIKQQKLESPAPQPPLDEDEDEYGLKASEDDPNDARKAIGQSIYSQAEKELREQAARQDLHKRTPGAFEERKARYRDEDDEEKEKKPRENLTPADYDPRDKLVEFPIAFTPKELKRDMLMLADVGLLMRWVFLSIFTGLTIYFTTLAIYHANYEPPNFASYFFSLMLTIFSVLIGAGTLSYLGSHFLFLVMSISSGLDDWDWPESGLFERLAETLFLVLALLITAVPFGALSTMNSALAIPSLLITFLLFPLVYLCMLDQGAPYLPWSNSIVSSLLRIPMKWLLFYAATFILLVVCGAIAYLVFRLAGWEQLAYVALPAGVLLVGYLLVYALWLGRLGWEIAGATPDEFADERTTPTTSFKTK